MLLPHIFQSAFSLIFPRWRYGSRLLVAIAYIYCNLIITLVIYITPELHKMKTSEYGQIFFWNEFPSNLSASWTALIFSQVSILITLKDYNLSAVYLLFKHRCFSRLRDVLISRWSSSEIPYINEYKKECTCTNNRRQIYRVSCNAFTYCIS